MFSVNSLLRSSRAFDCPKRMIFCVFEIGMRRSSMKSQPLEVGETISILCGGSVCTTTFFAKTLKLSDSIAFG